MIVSFLETSGNDLALVDFNLSLCFDARAVQSHIESRLRFFLGEWFINVAEGVPWFQDVFVKNPSIPVVRTLLSEVVSGTPGVKEIVSTNFEYDASKRTLYYFFEATTDVGQSVIVGNSFIIREQT